MTCPKNALNFNVDNVRVAKIVGSSLHYIQAVHVMVIRRDCEGTVKHVKDAKAVFGCAVDTSSTETKGTVLITSAKDLESYSIGEEQKMEEDYMIADSAPRLSPPGNPSRDGEHARVHTMASRCPPSSSFAASAAP